MIAASSVEPGFTKLGGPDMHFTLSLYMKYDLPPVAVKCGWLRGDRFPGLGGVPGVDVSWDNSELAPWGSFSCPAIGCGITDGFGRAKETFTPGPEQVHSGKVVDEHGVVRATAHVSTSLGGSSKLRKALDWWRDQGVMHWDVNHHKTGFPTGFQADVHAQTGNPATGQQTVNVTVAADRYRYAGNCKAEADTACTFKPTGITGKFTYTDTSQGISCTWDIPPYSQGTYLLQINSNGGPIAFELEFSATLPSPCDTGYVDIYNVTPYTDYEYGETNSTVSINNGAVQISWKY